MLHKTAQSKQALQHFIVKSSHFSDHLHQGQFASSNWTLSFRAAVWKCGIHIHYFLIFLVCFFFFFLCVESVQTSSDAVIRDEGKSYDVSEDITGTDCSMNGR